MNWSRPSIADRRACLLASDSLRCLLAGHFGPIDGKPSCRPCNRPYASPSTPATEQPLALELGTGRVFDNIQRDHYSSMLASALGDDKCGVTFVFPYSPEEFFNFCIQNTADREAVRVLRPLLNGPIETMPSDDDIRRAIFAVGRNIRTLYTHFKDSDRTCLRLASTFPLARLRVFKRVCRISASPVHKFADSHRGILFLLYPAVLGVAVPLVIDLRRELPAGDMAFFRRPIDAGVRRASIPDVEVALLHQPSANILVTLGRCDDGRIPRPSVFGLLDRKQKNLDVASTDELDEALRSGPFFDAFPLVTIIEQHCGLDRYISEMRYDVAIDEIGGTASIDNFHSYLAEVRRSEYSLDGA